MHKMLYNISSEGGKCPQNIQFFSKGTPVFACAMAQWPVEACHATRLSISVCRHNWNDQNHFQWPTSTFATHLQS